MSSSDVLASRPQGMVRTWFNLFKETFNAWNEDNALRLAAALAYYSVFSLAPLLVITIGIAGLVLDDEAATGQLYAGLRGYVGSQAAGALEAMVASASRPKAGILATVAGGATLLLGASGVLGQLKDALNTIWSVKIKKGTGIVFLIRSKFLNFGMVLVIGLLLLTSLLLSSLLAGVSRSVGDILNLPAWVWTILSSLLSFGIVTTLFALLFKVLPDARIRWRDVWMGAVITAALFEVGKTGLGWYLGRESTADAYGPAASVVLLILWVYYASCILLFGAEFTQAYAVSKGRRVEPSSHAQIAEARESTKALAVVEASGAEYATKDGPVGEAVPPPPPPHGSGTMFWQRLLNPGLKYLEGRGLLLSIEAKEAVGQATGLVVLAAVCCVMAFVAWTLLALALVGLLTNYFKWFWLTAVAATGALHLVATLIVAVFIWRRVKKGSWFAETFNELRKDRQWLKGLPN